MVVSTLKCSTLYDPTVMRVSKALVAMLMPACVCLTPLLLHSANYTASVLAWGLWCHNPVRILTLDTSGFEQRPLSGLVWWCGLVEFGPAWFELVWFVLSWSALDWYGWSGMAWSGMRLSGLVCGKVYLCDSLQFPDGKCREWLMECLEKWSVIMPNNGRL